MARRWQWRFDVDTETVAAGVSKIVQVLSQADFSKGETLTRVVGTVSVQKSLVSAAVIEFACGLIAVDEGAVAAGVPDPIIDAGADFIWWIGGVLMPEDTAAGFSTRHFFVDNRSMRIARSDQRLVFSLKCNTEGAVFGWGLRFGIKLV